MCIGHASPGFGPQEHDDSSMHTYLLLGVFCVTFVSPFFVGKVVDVAIQITQLYNLGVEQLKKEEDWPCVRPTFIFDLWQLAMNKEYFTCMVHWAWGKVGRGLQLKQQVVMTCEVQVETISIAGELIRWLGPLGRYVGTSDHATKLFCIGCGYVPEICSLIH